MVKYRPVKKKYMKFTPLIQKVLNRAAVLHEGQARKICNDPFIIHPFSVAAILSEYTDDEEVIAAALLHDVLEDVKGYREADMRREFGDRITDLVLEVSEDKDPNVEYDEKATWKERKVGYLKDLGRDSREALMIAAADKLHGLTDINDNMEELGAGIFDGFNARVGDQVWFFTELVGVLKGRLPDSGLVRDLEAQLERFKGLAG